MIIKALLFFLFCTTINADVLIEIKNTNAVCDYLLEKKSSKLYFEIENKLYLYTKNKIKEVYVDKKKLDYVYNITVEQKTKMMKEIKFEDKSLLIGAIILTSNNTYYIFIEDKKWYSKFDLYIYTNQKIRKVDTGNIAVYLENSIVFYDKKTNNILFSGWHIDEKKKERGIYRYDIKSKRTFLADRNEDNNNSIYPYRIPRTNKLVFIKNKKNCIQLVAKEIDF